MRHLKDPLFRREPSVYMKVSKKSIPTPPAKSSKKITDFHGEAIKNPVSKIKKSYSIDTPSMPKVKKTPKSLA